MLSKIALTALDLGKRLGVEYTREGAGWVEAPHFPHEGLPTIAPHLRAGV